MTGSPVSGSRWAIVGDDSREGASRVAQAQDCCSRCASEHVSLRSSIMCSRTLQYLGGCCGYLKVGS